MTSHTCPTAASPWVVRFAPLIPKASRVLDLACGGGRHTRLLAASGHAVEAVDRDEQAVARLAGLDGVTATCADLESGPWPFAAGTFGAIVVTNYLHRPLFPAIAFALADRGVLIYETYMRGQERIGRPSNPKFLLEPGELLAAFGALAVVAFEQGRVDAPEQMMIQRLCAVKAGLHDCRLEHRTDCSVFYSPAGRQ